MGPFRRDFQRRRRKGRSLRNRCLSSAELNVRIHLPPAESPLRTQKAGVLHSDFCEFIAWWGLLVPGLTFLRVHGDQPLQSPSLHPVLSAWLGMIGNMAMGRWAVARRTRTATPRLKRSCCRPFHIRCNPATFSDSVATDPTRWRPDTRWTDPIFSSIRTGRVRVWAARGYGPMD